MIELFADTWVNPEHIASVTKVVPGTPAYEGTGLTGAKTACIVAFSCPQVALADIQARQQKRTNTLGPNDVILEGEAAETMLEWMVTIAQVYREKLTTELGVEPTADALTSYRRSRGTAPME